MKTSHIGLIGCGRWGQFILRDLRSLGCEVSVLVRSETSLERAKQNNANRIITNLSEMPQVDGFVVATPTVTHGEILEQLLPFEKPIFVEKPMTNAVSSAQKIANLGAGQVFVMDKWRYHAGILALAELARSGELGAVLGLTTTRVGWGNPHLDTDAIWILAPHDLSIALEILGHIPEPMAAVAEVTSEAVALRALLGQSPWLSMEISARFANWKRRFVLHCELGHAELEDGYHDFITIYRDQGNARQQSPNVEQRFVGKNMPLLAELEEFVSFLRGGAAPKSGVQEGLLVVQTIAKLRTLAGLDA